MRKERPTESQTNKKPELGEVVQADKPEPRHSSKCAPVGSCSAPWALTHDTGLALKHLHMAATSHNQ